MPRRQLRRAALPPSHGRGLSGRRGQSVSRVRSDEPIGPQPLSSSPGRFADLHLTNDAEHRGPTLLLLQPVLPPAHLRRAGVRSCRAAGPADTSAGRDARAGRHRLRRRSRGEAPEAPAHACEPGHGAAPGQGHADAGRAAPPSTSASTIGP